MPPIEDLLPPWLPVSVVERTALAVAGVLLIWGAARVVRRYATRWIEDPGSRYVVRKGVNAAALVAAAVFVASVFVERIGGLGVALGVTGAAVAFALQQPLLSLAGWLALAFGGYYRTGDRVRVGGVTGDVIDVSLLRTTLFEVADAGGSSSYSGRVVRVANSAVLQQPVYNYSGDFPFLWDTIEVPVRHDSDRERARELLEEAVRETVGDYVPEAQAIWRSLRRKYYLTEGDVEPGVRVSADADWLTYTIRFASDYRRRLAVKDALWRRVLDAVDAADDVAIATAAQEITVTPGSEVAVRSPDGGRGSGETPGEDGPSEPRG